ncbi:MAG: PhoH family protein [Gammaproteobacteria bacterium WSBS_2016_MAG_OTU1]
MNESINISLTPACNTRLANLCGPMDGNITHLAEVFNVNIQRRGERFSVRGEAAEDAVAALQQLYARAEHEINLTDVQLCATGKSLPPPTRPNRQTITQTTSQEVLLQKIKTHSLTLCCGPAGVGKTHIALAAALQLLDDGMHERLVLTRPAVEAGGEKIGFLPGDMEQKVNPYLRPLHDILYFLLGKREAEKRMSDGRIEMIPLSFMRGLTIGNAVMIIDEAQNTTPGQLKMALTRLGVGGRIIVNGDESQSDLPNNGKTQIVSGLDDAVRRLVNIDDIAHHRFSEEDVVRHPLVKDIIRAYQKNNHALPVDNNSHAKTR